MRVLVTGGAGFIGSHIADGFIAAGYDVDILDNFSTGQRRNLPPTAVVHENDITDAAIRGLLSERLYCIVCHHAAQIDVRKSVADPIRDVEINVIGTINLLNSCLESGVEYVIFASTGGAIYGDQGYFPADENHPTSPDSPYGISKLTAEKFLGYLYKFYGLRHIALRYTNVYGPRQNPKGEAGVVSIFLEQLLYEKPCTIFGDGKQTRDYVYVGDVVRANLLAAERRPVGVCNISTGIETDVNTIYGHLASMLGISQKPGYTVSRKGEQLRSVCSWQKANQLLGWTPQVPLETGLKATVEYFEKLYKSG